MENKKITTCIFDFDGTVADTNGIIINSWQHVYESVKGAMGNEEEIVKTFGEPLEISMKKAFPEENTEKLLKMYRDFQANHFMDMIEPFPGMKEVMIHLKEEGYNVAIATSRMAHTTKKGLAKFGLLDTIDFLVTCEDTTKHKPDPEPVQLVLDHYNIDPEEALVIGDSMFDIKCAHNAGVKTALVGWALAVSSEDRNGPDGPEFYIEKAEDIFKIL